METDRNTIQLASWDDYVSLGSVSYKFLGSGGESSNVSWRELPRVICNSQSKPQSSWLRRFYKAFLIARLSFSTSVWWFSTSFLGVCCTTCPGRTFLFWRSLGFGCKPWMFCKWWLRDQFLATDQVLAAWSDRSRLVDWEFCPVPWKIRRARSPENSSITGTGLALKIR